MPSLRLLPIMSLPVLVAGTAVAEPNVVTDIAPVHSVVARVMAGIGNPALLLPPGVSPHGYALRPSEAAALEDADVVFWVGPALTPWLEGPLETVASGARQVALAEADGVQRLPIRVGGRFDLHEEDDNHDHHHDREDPASRGDAHASNGDEPAHRSADLYNGHIWLDPLNAAAMARAVADVLALEDPENAEGYQANAGAFAAEMEALVAEITDALDPVEDSAFIVFHDAYQYFEQRFGLQAAGSIALHDGDSPSPARMAEIRERIREADVACVFAEPQFEPRLIDTAIEGTQTRRGTLDPIGAGLEPGPRFYETLIRTLAADLAACLGEA